MGSFYSELGVPAFSEANLSSMYIYTAQYLAAVTYQVPPLPRAQGKELARQNSE